MRCLGVVEGAEIVLHPPAYLVDERHAAFVIVPESDSCGSSIAGTEVARGGDRDYGNGEESREDGI